MSDDQIDDLLEEAVHELELIETLNCPGQKLLPEERRRIIRATALIRDANRHIKEKKLKP